MADKKDIRLIALDLDGTTFNSDKQITERTRQAIMAAIRQGVIVMPSTGRAKNGLPESFISIPGVRYALTCNGGSIVDLEADKVVYGDYIPQTVAEKVGELFLKQDAMVDIYVDGCCVVDRKGYDRLMNDWTDMPAWFREYVKVSRVVTDDLDAMIKSGDYQIEKMLATFHDPELRARIMKELSFIDGIAVSSGLDINIEVNTETATKGRSIVRFAEKMGIPRDQIMACGDATNDYSMLEEAGFAVAMANACPEIKEIADYITLSNDEDGVAYAIEQFVLY